MRLHCSIDVCFRLLTAGWKFGYRRSKSRPRHRIPIQFSMPHIGFCSAYVPVFLRLGGWGQGFTLTGALFCSAATHQTNFKKLFLEAQPGYFSCLSLRYVAYNHFRWTNVPVHQKKLKMCFYFDQIRIWHRCSLYIYVKA